MVKRFEDLDDIDDDLDFVPVSTIPEPQSGNHKFKTYGTLHHKAAPSVYIKLKVPIWVKDFIDEYSEEHTNQTLVYARMLEVAAKHYKKQLLTGDVEIKMG